MSSSIEFFVLALLASTSLALSPAAGLTGRRWFQSDADRHEQIFDEYVAEHERDFVKGTPAYQERLALFSSRVAAAEAHNQRKNRRWSAAINHFSDRTVEELRRVCGLRSSAVPQSEGNGASRGFRSMIAQRRIGETKDWTQYKMLFIRDQGSCGSCWAMAASTVLDAHAEIAGVNRTFSTQEIVDCVPNPKKCGGSGGCDGATVELAMQYALERGLSSNSDYRKYEARNGECSEAVKDDDTESLELLTGFSKKAGTFRPLKGAVGPSFGMTSWERLPSNKMRPLLHAVFNYGPVAISVAANDLFWYSDGIFDGCNDFVVNHAVTLVGFGRDSYTGEKYWRVQNSWGDRWGENGRVRILRLDDEEQHCGLDNQPQDGIACEGETQPVKVCGTCGVLYDSVLPHFGRISA